MPVTFLNVQDHPKCEVLLSPLVTHVELSFSEVHAGGDCPTTYHSLGPADSSSQLSALRLSDHMVQFLPQCNPALVTVLSITWGQIQLPEIRIKCFVNSKNKVRRPRKGE